MYHLELVILRHKGTDFIKQDITLGVEGAVFLSTNPVFVKHLE
jgi:hypothetical protein